jgi:hypothetical protein
MGFYSEDLPLPLGPRTCSLSITRLPIFANDRATVCVLLFLKKQTTTAEVGGGGGPETEARARSGGAGQRSESGRSDRRLEEEARGGRDC